MRKIIQFLILFTLLLSTTEKIYAQVETTYEGPVYNIFFHPLIVYPSLAFNSANKHLSYMDDWFVTLGEFKKIIQELYDHGFVLVSPTDVFTESKDSYGNRVITRKKLNLAQGKKPLILSLDDYNYYKTMKQHGTIYRFEVDNRNRLVTVTNHNDQLLIRADQEVPQVLENFIEDHPDFSFNHARGIISLTGYHGIFGYDTNQLSASNYQAQLNEVKKVIIKLKSMGWKFASHSYFHVGEEKQTEPKFQESEIRWQQEVGSIVGPTPYYVFPFGDAWNKNPTRMAFLKSIGYKYFFGVAPTCKTKIGNDEVVMTRFPMDGRALRGKYKGLHVFLDSNPILDRARL